MNIIINPARLNVSVSDTGVSASTGTPVVKVDPPTYEGSYTVTPSEQQQTLETEGLKMANDVTVEAVPSDYVGSSIPRQSELSASGSTVTAPAGYYAESATKSVADATWHGSTQLSRTPSISVSENGLVTATIPTNSSNLYPITSDGYALASHAYPVSATGSNTFQLPSLGATTYTPSSVAQEIAAGQFLTGKQTISAIAPPYYDMSGANAWMGAGAELVGTFTLADKKLSATDFNTWTPSTTATDILATRTAGTFTADGVIDQYDYIIIWETKLPLVYTSGATDVARPLFLAGYHAQELIRRPNSFNNILAGNANNTVNISAFSSGSFLPYYNNNGVQSYTYNASYGFYATLTANTLSSATAAAPTITLKSPKVTARCSTTYMSTANAGKIDKDKSVISQKAIVYKVKKPAFLQGIYYNIMRLVQEVANA